MDLELIKNVTSVLVAMVTAGVALLAGLRARKLGYWRAFNTSDSSADLEVTTAAIKKVISETAPDASPESKQYVLLREYHAQGIAQSKISFWFSLVFAALGFAVIIMGLLTLQADKDFSKQTGTFVNLLAGTIIDSVSALFFVQSNKSRQLMSDFFDKLRVDRKLEESLRLAKDIHNPDLRDRLQTLIALNFSDVKPADGLLASLLGVEMHQLKPVTAVTEADMDKSGRASA